MIRLLPFVFWIVACAAPFVKLGARDLWNPDEADHAAAARELLTEGRWAVPTIAGDPYAEKPPLQLWGIVLSAKLRGTDVDEFDARLPSAVGGILLLTAAFVLGWRCGGRWHASLVLLATATAGEAVMRLRWCQVDALFAGLLACAAHALLETLDRPRWTTTLALGAALGLATLTKGPLAIALLAVGLTIDAMFERALGRPTRLPWKHLGAATALAASVALPWYVVLASESAASIDRSFVHENFRRFFHSQDHRAPPWYYLAGPLWTSLAPASLLLPPALTFVWRTAVGLRPRFALPSKTFPYTFLEWQRITGADLDAIHTRDPRIVRFAVAMFLGGLLIFSAASSKQGKYLLPLTPFVALIVADFARNVVDFGKRWERAWTTAVLSTASLVSIVFALLALSASWFGARADAAFAALAASVGGPNEVVLPVSILLGPALLLGVGGFAVLAAGSASRGSLRLTWLLATQLLAVALGAGSVMDALDVVKSPRPAVEAAMARLEALRGAGLDPEYAVYFVDRTADRPVPSWTGTAPFVYYARGAARRPRILRGLRELEAALAPGAPPLVLVLREAYYQQLPAPDRARLRPRFEDEVGSRTLVVVDSAP